MPQDQRVRQRVRERSDADLQRAAVLDEARRVQRHGIVGQRCRLLGRREQRVMRALRLQHDVAFVHVHLGRARHVGQVGVDFDGERERLAGRPARLDVGHHVERDVGVGAEADSSLALRVRRHQLAEDIGADALEVPGHLGIVETGIGSLHVGIGEPRSGLHEKLGDLDVGRQAASAQRFGVVEVGIALEQPVEEGFDEATLQAGAVGWAHQAEPGEDAQPQAPVRLGQAVERIDEGDGLAHADRDGERDVAPGAIDDRLGAADGIAGADGQCGVPDCWARRLAQTAPLNAPGVLYCCAKEYTRHPGIRGAAETVRDLPRGPLLASDPGSLRQRAPAGTTGACICRPALLLDLANALEIIGHTRRGAPDDATDND